MGVVNLAGRAGKRVAKEAGYVIGTYGLAAGASVIKKSAQVVKNSVVGELHKATPEELSAIKAEFDDALSQLTPAEYKRQARNWQVRSRWHYVAALLLFLVAAYFLLVNPGWTGLNALGLAALSFSHGLRAAYRYWQMKTQTFFVEGAFMGWLKSGAWLV
ncbi:MAG: hypothetical protein M0P59_03475 [Gallionella sp.]|jgi:hypothetical protein|nr:hypothetical protein [Gallionella sp.]MCK9353200.1 hypothetical protein [Gallionella sp.]